MLWLSNVLKFKHEVRFTYLNHPPALLVQSVYGSHVAQRSKANSQVPVIDRTHAWLADVERDRQVLSEGIRSAEEVR